MENVLKYINILKYFSKIPVKSSGLIYCNVIISIACILFEQRGFGPCFKESWTSKVRKSLAKCLKPGYWSETLFDNRRLSCRKNLFLIFKLYHLNEWISQNWENKFKKKKGKIKTVYFLSSLPAKNKVWEDKIAVKSWKISSVMKWQHISSLLYLISISAKHTLYLTFLMYLAHLKVIIFLIKKLTKMSFLFISTEFQAVIFNCLLN